jgi:preprotein translocase subunit SecF
VGIGVGTYSSVFVAAPLLVAFEQRKQPHPSQQRTATMTKREPA